MIKDAIKKTMALVMAGGKGTRLKDLTNIRAKPAVYFGGKFRIIDFSLSNTLNSGIRKIGVLTQYRAHSLMRHLQRSWGGLRAELGEFLELMPAAQQYDDSMWYRGTADAITQNIDIIKSHRPKYILVLAGDHIYKMDYSIMLSDHIKYGAKCTVGCVEVSLEDAKQFGVMTVDSNFKVVDFSEKPDNPSPMPGSTDKAMASMGIYIFNTDFIFDELRKDFKDTDSSHDFGKDVIPKAVKEGAAYAHPFLSSCVYSGENDKGYWRDVGTLDSFWQANIDLTYPLPAFDIYNKEWPLLTHQPILPPAKLIYNEKARRGVALDTILSGGCIISGGKVERSVLFSNVKINSFADVSGAVIFPNVSIGRHARVKNVIIEKGCQIPPYFVVGEDPKGDAKRFYRTDRGITLITSSMI